MLESAILRDPLCGGWLDFLWLPSRRQTEKARQKLLQSRDMPFIFAANPLAAAFALRKLEVGDLVRVDGKSLFFKGVYPKMEYPEAMIFYNHHQGRYCQYYFPIIDEFEIVKSGRRKKRIKPR